MYGFLQEMRARKKQDKSEKKSKKQKASSKKDIKSFEIEKS